MTSERLPSEAAAVPAASVLLNRGASIAKQINLSVRLLRTVRNLWCSAKAASQGSPSGGAVDRHELHQRPFESAITAPGPHAEMLGRIAARPDAVLSFGVNERAAHSLGRVFNSNLIFDRHGQLVNHRRKVVETWYERLTWSHGDGYDLKPVDLEGWGSKAAHLRREHEYAGAVHTSRTGRATRHRPICKAPR